MSAITLKRIPTKLVSSVNIIFIIDSNGKSKEGIHEGHLSHLPSLWNVRGEMNKLH